MKTSQLAFVAAAVVCFLYGIRANEAESPSTSIIDQQGATSYISRLPVAAATPMPLGTFTLKAVNTTDCPAGFTCNNFTVSVPGVSQNENGIIATQAPTVPIKGVVVFFAGSDGYIWWSGPVGSSNNFPLVPGFFQSLLNAGFELVQVKHAWIMAPTGVQSGHELLACRPATVIKWVYDNIYAPLGLHANLGECGFCITGQSGGASQVAYALGSYGLDSIVNASIPTGGPELTDIAGGCLQVDGYAFTSNLGVIDEAYGYTASQTGPCAAGDATFTNTWNANSIDTDGGDYNYPTARIEIISGGNDKTVNINHINLYYQVLLQAQQPLLSWVVVSNMGHDIEVDSNGLSTLTTALTATGFSSPTPSPTPTPTPTPTPRPTPTPTPTATPTPTPTPTPASVPVAPTATAATDITNSKFTANWHSVSGASGYRLDVATSSSFSGNYVKGYHNLDVGNVTRRKVAGLKANTTYYYRLRAYNTVGTSPNSNVMSVKTSP